jgi:hypothetical protein
VLSAGPRRSSIFIGDTYKLPMALGGWTIETSISQVRTYRRGSQRERNGKRAVACVGTDLEIAPNAQQAREERREVGLLRRKQHVHPGSLARTRLKAGCSRKPTCIRWSWSGSVRPSVRGVMAACSTLVCRLRDGACGSSRGSRERCTLQRVL